MEINESSFFSSEANTIFGEHSAPLGSYWLESVLRYIAVKQCGGDMSKLKPIKTYPYDYNRSLPTGNLYADCYKNHKQDIFIFNVLSFNNLPTIDEVGWKALNQAPFPASNFLSQISPTSVFINTDLQKVIIFVKQYTEEWLQTLAAILMRILPWIYPHSDKIPKDDQLLFKAVHDKDHDTFVKLIEKVASTIDFRALRIQRDLHGWNNSFRNTRKSSLESSIVIQIDNIIKLESNLATAYTKYDNAKLELDALISGLEEDSTELGDFFCCHKRLNVLQIIKDHEGNKLIYSIIDTIDYYDQDAFINSYNNKSSYFYYNTVAPETREIFYAIFAMHRGRLRTQACFELQNTSALTAKSTSYADYSTVPHPHIGYSGCLGQNSIYVANYMKKGEWDMAIEQTIAATKNIHFGDSGILEW